MIDIQHSLYNQIKKKKLIFILYGKLYFKIKIKKSKKKKKKLKKKKINLLLKIFSFYHLNYID